MKTRTCHTRRALCTVDMPRVAPSSHILRQVLGSKASACSHESTTSLQGLMDRTRATYHLYPACGVLRNSQKMIRPAPGCRATERVHHGCPRPMDMAVSDRPKRTINLMRLQHPAVPKHFPIDRLTDRNRHYERLRLRDRGPTECAIRPGHHRHAPVSFDQE